MEKDFNRFLTYLMSKVGKKRMFDLMVSYQRSVRKKGDLPSLRFVDFVKTKMGEQAAEFYTQSLLGQKGYDLSSAPQNLRKRNLASTPAVDRKMDKDREKMADELGSPLKEQTMLKENRYRDIDYVQAVSDIANKYGEGISIFKDPSQGIYNNLERETYDEELKKSVIKLQKKLGLRGRQVDGWFGPKTACALRKRLNPNIKIGCFKKEWVMKLADNLREEELANAKKGASKPKPKKAKAKKTKDDRSRDSFSSYKMRHKRLNREINRIEIFEKIGQIKMRDPKVRKKLTEIRKQLKTLKKEGEADKNLKNSKTLKKDIPDDIQRIDDMLGDPLGIDNSGLNMTDKDAKAFSDVGPFKFKESKFSNDKDAKKFMVNEQAIPDKDAVVYYNNLVKKAEREHNKIFYRAGLSHRDEPSSSGLKFVKILEPHMKKLDKLYRNGLLLKKQVKDDFLKIDVETGIEKVKDLLDRTRKVADLERKKIKPSSPSQKYRSCQLDVQGLSLGCKGADVMNLQKALQGLGYNIKEDGFLGRKTMRAYRDWAKNNNAPMDLIRASTYDKIKKQADKIESDVVSGIEKELDMKKSRASRPGQPLDQSIPIKAANIGDKKLKESKFSNDKELQNLMESFKTFTRND